jgi:hypothetical protein
VSVAWARFVREVNYTYWVDACLEQLCVRKRKRINKDLPAVLLSWRMTYVYHFRELQSNPRRKLWLLMWPDNIRSDKFAFVKCRRLFRKLRQSCALQSSMGLLQRDTAVVVGIDIPSAEDEVKLLSNRRTKGESYAKM